jgi:hypothetical protein
MPAMPEDAPLPETLWTELAATNLSVFLREATWGYPVLEIAHIIGLALVVGSIFAFDLRLLGVNAGLPMTMLGRHLLPWVWAGFCLNAVSGGLLFLSNPVEFAANPALAAKLGLIALAGINALYFQVRLAPAMDAWNSNTPAPAAARISALFSIVLWLGVIIAGRLMAYVV